MKNLDVYVSSAVCLSGLLPPYSLSTDCTPDPISAAEADEVLRKQRLLVQGVERAHLHKIHQKALENDAYFKSVEANSLAVGLLVAEEYLRLETSPLPANSPFIESAIYRYGGTSQLDPRDMLFEEPTWRDAYGTCFLVGQNRVLTTWHTFCNDNHARAALHCGNLRVVFDYVVCDNGRARNVFSRSASVFKVKRIESLPCPPQLSWVVLELDCDAVCPTRTPLVCSQSALAPDTPVYSLGHPNKLTQRYVRTNLPLEIESGQFFAYLDAYDGSSGSPVFSAIDHKIVGMVNKSTQPTGLVKICGETRYVSQICLPEYARKATLCIDSAAFKVAC